MIRIKPQLETIEMEIKLNLPHESIFAFLQTKGYEIKPWLYCYKDESFPNGTSHHERWTFTATKPDENQYEETIFTVVFEKEIKEFLNEIKYV